MTPKTNQNIKSQSFLCTSAVSNLKVEFNYSTIQLFNYSTIQMKVGVDLKG